MQFSEKNSPLSFRPGFKVLHRFRSNVIDMTVFNDRLYVITERGAYRSNKAATRWYRVKI